MSYETNLSDARRHIIAEFIEDGRKRKHRLRDIVDALLYLVKTATSMAICAGEFSEMAICLLVFQEI